MNLDALSLRSCEWLQGVGPESDIVVSTRIRLARNLGAFPFIRRCTDIDRVNLESLVHLQLTAHQAFASTMHVNVAELEPLDRQFLVERQLISRELSDCEGARSVLIDPQERFSVMVNEEDHLRLQAMRSGLEIASTWAHIDALDDAVQEKLEIAFHPRWGFLTACPTNVGTGMRVSVMLHLPALVQTRQIDRVFRSLQKISLAVRGLFGEGSQAMGDFYQISNQLTLGRSESELLEQVGEVVPALIDYERKAREFLLKENRPEMQEQVGRALETLKRSSQISSEETMHLLSKLRMGVHLALIDSIDIPTINRLFLQTQPAHLQKRHGATLSTAERNQARADYLQAELATPGAGRSDAAT